MAERRQVDLTVMWDRNATVAEAEYRGHRATGSAKRMPGDRSSARIGADLATARALRGLAAKLHLAAEAAADALNPDPPAEAEVLRTKTGRVLVDAEIELLADEAEQGYDVSHLLNVGHFHNLGSGSFYHGHTGGGEPHGHLPSEGWPFASTNGCVPESWIPDGDVDAEVVDEDEPFVEPGWIEELQLGVRRTAEGWIVWTPGLPALDLTEGQMAAVVDRVTSLPSVESWAEVKR